MPKVTQSRKVKKPKPSRLDTKLKSNGLLTVRELAQYLDIAEITVYRWARQKNIPSIRMGRSWRFRVEEINKWLKEIKER